MKRAHRSSHRLIWIVLTLVVAIGFTMALVKRKPQKKKTAQAPAIEQVLTTQIAGLEQVSGRRVSL